MGGMGVERKSERERKTTADVIDNGREYLSKDDYYGIFISTNPPKHTLLPFTPAITSISIVIITLANGRKQSTTFIPKSFLSSWHNVWTDWFLCVLFSFLYTITVSYNQLVGFSASVNVGYRNVSLHKTLLGRVRMVYPRDVWYSC